MPSQWEESNADDDYFQREKKKPENKIYISIVFSKKKKEITYHLQLIALSFGVHPVCFPFNFRSFLAASFLSFSRTLHGARKIRTTWLEHYEKSDSIMIALHWVCVLSSVKPPCVRLTPKKKNIQNIKNNQNKWYKKSPKS